MRFTYEEDEAFRKGKEDARHHRMDYEFDRYRHRATDDAYFDGRRETEREEARRAEARREEEREDEERRRHERRMEADIERQAYDDYMDRQEADDEQPAPDGSPDPEEQF